MTITGQQAIGVDIGGTKMAVALVNASGEVVQSQVIPTEADLGFLRAVERLGDAMAELSHRAQPGGIVGIGIGCAGPVDSNLGWINNPYTLAGWDHCDIVSPLQRRFGVPVHLENDADVAAFGEFARGTGAGFDPVVMLTFGTGIGGGAVVAGHVYRGVNGEHPELGHVPVLPNGPECYCGLRGCLESIASGTAIGIAGQAAGYADARAVFAAAQAGQSPAREIIDRAVRAGQTGAWTLCHTFLPQRLILGGGMMDDHFELFADAMRQQLKRATQFSPGSVTIARAALGNNAGMIGAGMLALRPTPLTGPSNRRQ